MNVAIVLAAGVGTRFGGKEPKQFYVINGKPVIAHTLDVLNSCDYIDAIQLVIREEYRARINEIIKEYDYKKIKWLVTGGDSFQMSLMNGIYYLVDNDICLQDDLVQVHIAASPFVTNEIISSSFITCQKYGNAFSAEPIRFPICHSFDGRQSDFVDEADGYYQLEPPWTFNLGEISALYKAAEMDGIIDSIGVHTVSLYKHYGKAIYLSDYARNNIKITTKDDVVLFNALLDHKRKDSKYE